MNQQLTLLLATLSGAFIISFIFSASEFVYDFAKIKNRKRFKKAKNSHNPSFTIIVFADHNASTLHNCLMSIKNCKYNNYNLLVIDNASCDGSTKIVNSFKAKYPKVNIRLVKKIKPTSIDSSVLEYSKKYASGEYLLILEGNQILKTNALLQLKYHFLGLRGLTHIQLRAYPEVVLTGIHSLSSHFESYIQNRKHKLLSNLKAHKYFIADALAVNKKAYIDKSKINQKSMYYYSDLDIVGKTSTKNNKLFNRRTNKPGGSIIMPVKPVNKPLKGAINIFSHTEIYLLILIIYLSIVLGNSTIFVIGWVIYTFVIIPELIAGKNLSAKQKLWLGLHLPIAYILMFLNHLSSMSYFVFGKLHSNRSD